LLLAFLELQWLCYIKGVPTVREHPAPYSGRPTTWDLDVEVAFYQQEHTHKCYLDRCLTDTDSKKPTLLGTSHLPQLAEAIRVLPGGGRCSFNNRTKYYLCDRQVHKSACGRNDDKTWNTAALKVYGYRLCGLLAHSFFAWLQQNDTSHSIPTRGENVEPNHLFEYNDDAAQFYVPSDPYIVSSYGQDYAGFTTNKAKRCSLFQETTTVDVYDPAAQTVLDPMQQLIADRRATAVQRKAQKMLEWTASLCRRLHTIEQQNTKKDIANKQRANSSLSKALQSIDGLGLIFPRFTVQTGSLRRQRFRIPKPG